MDSGCLAIAGQLKGTSTKRMQLEIQPRTFDDITKGVSKVNDSPHCRLVKSSDYSDDDFNSSCCLRLFYFAPSTITSFGCKQCLTQRLYDVVMLDGA